MTNLRALLIESPCVRALVAAGELEPTNADPVITPAPQVWRSLSRAIRDQAEAEVRRGERVGKVREANERERDRNDGVEVVRHPALMGD